jgi:hypothetical protein
MFPEIARFHVPTLFRYAFAENVFVPTVFRVTVPLWVLVAFPL